MLIGTFDFVFSVSRCESLNVSYRSPLLHSIFALWIFECFLRWSVLIHFLQTLYWLLVLHFASSYRLWSAVRLLLACLLPLWLTINAKLRFYTIRKQWEHNFFWPSNLLHFQSKNSAKWVKMLGKIENKSKHFIFSKSLQELAWYVFLITLWHLYFN